MGIGAGIGVGSELESLDYGLAGSYVFEREGMELLAMGIWAKIKCRQPGWGKS